jgi:hypothetical protein
MITWSVDEPSVIRFEGTNTGDGTAMTFTLTRQGDGPVFTATLAKNGTNQGSLTFDNIQVAKDLFGIAAANL